MFLLYHLRPVGHDRYFHRLVFQLLTATDWLADSVDDDG